MCDKTVFKEGFVVKSFLKRDFNSTYRICERNFNKDNVLFI